MPYGHKPKVSSSPLKRLKERSRSKTGSNLFLFLFIVHLQEKDQDRQKEEAKKGSVDDATPANQSEKTFKVPEVPRRVPAGVKNITMSAPSKTVKRKLDFEEKDQPTIPTGKKAYYELLGNSISKDEFIHMQSYDAEGNMIAKEIFATNKFSKFVTSVINANPEKSGIIIKSFLDVLNNLE